MTVYLVHLGDRVDPQLVVAIFAAKAYPCSSAPYVYCEYAHADIEPGTEYKLPNVGFTSFCFTVYQGLICHPH